MHRDMHWNLEETANAFNGGVENVRTTYFAPKATKDRKVDSISVKQTDDPFV